MHWLCDILPLDRFLPHHHLRVWHIAAQQRWPHLQLGAEEPWALPWAVCMSNNTNNVISTPLSCNLTNRQKNWYSPEVECQGGLPQPETCAQRPWEFSSYNSTIFWSHADVDHELWTVGNWEEGEEEAVRCRRKTKNVSYFTAPRKGNELNHDGRYNRQPCCLVRKLLSPTPTNKTERLHSKSVRWHTHTHTQRDRDR